MKEFNIKFFHLHIKYSAQVTQPIIMLIQGSDQLNYHPPSQTPVYSLFKLAVASKPWALQQSLIELLKGNVNNVSEFNSVILFNSHCLALPTKA